MTSQNNLIKKYLIFLTLTLFLISNVLTGTVSANDISGNEDQIRYTLEHISSDELEQHPDVKKFIEENQSDIYLLNEEQTDSELISLYGLEEKISLPDVNDIELNRIESKYGLERPKTEILASNQDLIIERNPKISKIVNVWYVTYFETNSGFRINVNGVGSSTIHFSGQLYNYKASGTNWTLDKGTSFTKTTKTNGVVYDWKVPKSYVSDYFTYHIKATSNQTEYTYSRSDRFYQRYNFDSGIYKYMQALGGERHHLVSRLALSNAKFNADLAPAIRMLKVDHMKTPNWGNKTESTLFRAEEMKYLAKKDYEGLIKYEVTALKKIGDPEGKYSNLQTKYYDALVGAILLTETYFGI